MKQLIKVTVNYPVSFEMEIDPGKSLDEIKDDILDQAEHVLEISSVKPVIQYCYECENLKETKGE